MANFAGWLENDATVPARSSCRLELNRLALNNADVMRPEEIMGLLRRRPFTPIRIHTTTGQSYDVRHPDQVLVLRQRLDIGIPADEESGILDRVEYVSMLHVTRIEDLPAQKNGEARKRGI